MLNETDLSADQIKKILEDAYDIPFFVSLNNHPDGVSLKVKLSNNDDLFALNLEIKNWIRLTIKVEPEKFSAFMLKDMGESTEKQKEAFSRFASQISKRRGKCTFKISGITVNPEDWTTWPEHWNQFSYRVTRSPITAENETFNFREIIETWVVLVLGMFLSILNIIPEQESQVGELEGRKFSVELTKYERSPINRQLCLAAHGFSCKICGMNFEEIYGEIGKGFIHVHHLNPLSLMDKPVFLDPVRDLIPVCPNCHAMLHKKNPPYTPEELKSIILSNNESYKQDE